MGDKLGEPDLAGASAAMAAAFSELDEVLWNPISTAAVARAHPRFDELVLDACCGDGAAALPAAELVGPGGVVDAVDLSEPLVAIARERAGERMPQLRLHVADVTTWEPTGYDLVQCVLGVSSFDDLEAGTRHLIERARPGGRVAITVWARGALDPLPEVLAAALPDGGAMLDADAPALSAGLESIDTAGSLAQWLTRLGLVGVRAHAVQRHLDLTAELAWTLVLGTRLRLLLGELDAAEVASVRERYLAVLEVRAVTSVDVTTLIGIGRRAAAAPVE
ncbi:class I SAM-dependent methyltransferase [Agromyces badenianii]|uniref:class I SAM-dependent methyltransferase n=1 Tax=Agromyces badenianii TaxID=2080742 RepID=UPI000D590F5B|nr:class I SAM-dependent methyltransferase [Agromyces badenianii]PWC05906.1 SAM-dependent methyltransferase [Agromyces badenianii]